MSRARGAGRSGLRFVWRLAAADIGHNRRRFMPMVAVVVLTVVALSGLSVLLSSMHPTVATHVRTDLGTAAAAKVTVMGGRVSQLPDASYWQADTVTTPVATLQEAVRQALPNGAALATELTGTTRLITPGHTSGSMNAASATYTDPVMASLVDLVSGTLPARAGEVAVSRSVARTYGLGVGAHVRLSQADAAPVTVTGIYRDSARGFDLLMGPGTLWQEPAQTRQPGPQVTWYVTSPAPISWDTVQQLNAHGLVVESRAVLLNPPPAAEVPLLDSAVSTPGANAWHAATLLALAILIVAQAGLLVAPSLAVAARRNAHMFALLTAQGARARDSRRFVLAQAVMLGAFSAVIGVAVGLLLAVVLVTVTLAAGNLAFPNLSIAPLQLVAAGALAVVIAVAGAWWPARATLRAQPAGSPSGAPSAARSRRRGWIPAGAALLGLVTVGVGLLADVGVLVVVGALVAALGCTLAARPAIHLMCRLLATPRSATRGGWGSRLPGRMALRDLERNPGRSVPTLAAIVGAVALATAGMVVCATQWNLAAEQWKPRAANGTLMVYLGDVDKTDASGSPLAPSSGSGSQVSAASPEGASVSAIATEAESLMGGGSAALVNAMEVASDGATVSVDVNPQAMCPAWANVTGTNAPMKVTDPNCASDKINGDTNTEPRWALGTSPLIVVDDGTLVKQLGLPGAQQAAQALAQGKVLLTRNLDLWADGTAHLTMQAPDAAALNAWWQRHDAAVSAGQRFDERQPAPLHLGEVTAPAVAVDWPSAQYAAFVPPSLIQGGKLAGQAVRTATVGLVVPARQGAPTQSEDQIRSDLVQLGASDAAIAHPYSMASLRGLLAGLAVAAGLIGVGAAWAASALAVADADADRRCLVALGASRRLMRQVAARGGAFLAAPGVLLGTVAGLALAAGVSRAAFYQPGWHLTVPWLALAAVVVASVAAAAWGPALTTADLRPGDVTDMREE